MRYAAAMATLATRPRRLTSEEFFAEYEGAPGRWELVGGEPRLRSGGFAAHANVAGNIYHCLRSKLGGSGCRLFNSDMGLWIASDHIRYPDVAIYCDPRDRDADMENIRTFRFPVVIFEVLSRSTARIDRVDKLLVYQDLGSVRLIVLSDPDRRMFETYERLEDSWSVGHHLPGTTLSALNPGFTITADEMFADD